MEWTREKRYLPYKDWNADTLLNLQAQAARSPYQLHYHIHPMSGLMNDPNGFSYFNHAYQLFYQSYPFGAVHGLKSWVHMQSTDLVHWRNLGIAIKPDTMADSHGAYSGSAIPVKDKLFIIYTGNHRDKNWVRTPYQVGAWMDKNNQITKIKQPLFRNPKHISEHFRDPNILKDGDTYYALLGAQDAQSKHGHIDVWKSTDLKDWQEVGFLHFTDQPMGYMIECPSLVKVDGHAVLIFCPQGLDQDIKVYQNIYPNMYIIGDAANLNKPAIVHPGQLHNLDEGFDVYATQAFNAPDGHAYAVSWVGLPDTNYPTDDENWANCLSQIKELSIKNGHLIQKPVKAMTSLRQNVYNLNNNTIISDNAINQYELQLNIQAGQSGDLHLAANKDLSSSLQIKFDTSKGRLTLDRSNAGESFAMDHGQTRSINLPEEQTLKLDIFIDHSLIEIFVNDGEHVMTARYFADPANRKIAFAKPVTYAGKMWMLNNY